MVITWEIAAAIIGVIATICATILKIVLTKKQEPNGHAKQQKMCEDHKMLTMESKQTIAVLEAKLDANKEDNKEEHTVIRAQVKDLTDLIHQLLTKLAE